MRRILLPAVKECGRGIMSSHGAVNKANPSLDKDDTADVNLKQDYRIVLPLLPKESLGCNAVILHADITGRPYRIQDFKPALKLMVNPEDIAQFGAYQMNHVWLITTCTQEAKEKLLSQKECIVKGKKCLVLDASQREVTLKVFWLPHNVSNQQVQLALGGFGKVKHVEREKWRDDFFEHVETTTRVVKLTLHEDVTAESIPHLMKVGGSQVLVSVPGRPRLCLRCREVGHIRQHCKTPRCTTCRRFGHPAEECIRSYAQLTRPVREEYENVMDQHETDVAITNVPEQAIENDGVLSHDSD
ncbi:uncharacterized protein LOC135394154 [Ornithodoros turicata]|uniref:uncharacterized protein LOC135394154 n=1 Tax=Ornithodoros turicata TaxID=34597 RepID=UPI003138D7C1